MTLFYKYLRSLKYHNLFCFKALIYIRQRISGRLFSTGSNGVVLNCGGPRSGSTLLNMIIKEILLFKLESENNYVDDPKRYSERLSSYAHFSLIKTHRLFSNTQGLIRKGQIIAFMTHRDIRDVTVSLYQKGWIGDIDEFIESKDLKQIAFSSIAYAKMIGMNVLSYQQLMDDPRGAISFVASKLSVQLSDEQIDHISNTVSTENVSLKIGQINLEDDSEVRLDGATGLHMDHIKDGKSGKWRDILSTKEADAIAGECSDYMTLFNYQNE